MHLLVAILVISFASLMASSNEAQASVGKFPFCASGRCIRATGIVITHYPDCVSSATVMLDLWDEMIRMDSRCLPYLERTIWDIQYHRTSVRFDAPDTGGSFIVGLPGFFRMSFATYTGYGDFFGIGSFYYKMERTP